MTKFRSAIPLCVYLALALLFIGLQPSVNNADYVTYRFAANLMAGRGLIYWTADPQVSTFPLMPLALAALSAIGHIDIPTAGRVITVISAAFGAFFIYRLLGNRWLIGIAYLLLTMFWNPSPIMLGLLAVSLAGVEAAFYRRWLLSGILIGLAILIDPLAILLALLILILALREKSWWHYALPAALIPAIGLLIIRFSLNVTNFQSVVPGMTIGGLTAIAGAIMLIFRLKRFWPTLKENPYLAALVAWSVIAVFSAAVTRSTITILIAPGLAALFSFLRWRWLLLALVCLDVWGNLTGWATIYDRPGLNYSPDQALTWIAANTTSDATIATEDIGQFAYLANRRIIDLSGTFQPLQPLDQTFFLEYAPDLVVTARDVPWTAFPTTYQATDQGDESARLYRRVVNYAPLDDHGVDVNFGRGDLHLSNVAIGRILHPGDLVRVRLDWQLLYLPITPVEIKLDLLNDQYKPVKGLIDHIPPEGWMLGDDHTYHVLLLPSDIPAGKYSLWLGVNYRLGSFGQLNVAQIEVAP